MARGLHLRNSEPCCLLSRRWAISELRVILHTAADMEKRATGSPWKGLAAEFPAVEICWGAVEPGIPSLPLKMEEWESQNFNFHDFDRRWDSLAEAAGKAPFGLALTGSPEQLQQAAPEVLTRCQRWMNRRNAASHGELFDKVLAEHRDAHDLSKPLVRADFNHALDTWQWVLRLDRKASLPLQLAALFHDIERLTSEADARVEQNAADYQAFKDDHARRGAELTETLLEWVGVNEKTRQRAARLIERHEQPAPPGDPDEAELALLNDADALSFFSLNSAGYLDYFGPEQTRRKVAFTLGRIRPESRRYLEGLRLRPLVSAALVDELGVRETRETAA